MNVLNNLLLRDSSALMSAFTRIFVLDSIVEVGILMSVEAAHVHTVPDTCLGNHVRYGDFIARSPSNVKCKCHWQDPRARVGSSVALGR